jgi:hypothetical protein
MSKPRAVMLVNPSARARVTSRRSQVPGPQPASRRLIDLAPEARRSASFVSRMAQTRRSAYACGPAKANSCLGSPSAYVPPAVRDALSIQQVADFTGRFETVAEREGFEPPIRLPVCRISSAVHSTALPPLRSRKQPAKAACGRPLSNQARPERQETGKGRATYIERPGKGAGRRPAKRCSTP